MQWFIDIIMALVQTALDALEIKIHSELGYFNRGDPSSVDWNQATLTADDAWHDLDCSAIVPANAKAISFNVGLRDELAGVYIQLRRNGNVNNAVRGEVRTQVSYAFLFQDITCACDEDRKVEYRSNAVTFSNITIVVKGWWLR